MRKREDMQDDEDFQVLLSTQDYQELKRSKDNYGQLKSKYEEKLKVLESQNINLSSRLKTVTRQNESMTISYNSFCHLIDGICLNVSDKVDLLIKENKSQQQLKKSVRDSKYLDISVHKYDQKLRFISECFDEAFSIFNVSLAVQQQKTTSLTKENQFCRQEIKKLNEQSQIQQIERINIFRKFQFEMQEQKKDIEDQTKIIKQLQQQISQLHQQNRELIQKLEKTQNSRVQMSKQLDLLQQQNAQYQKQNRELQDQVKQYQQHIQILKSKQNQNQSRKSSSNSKGKKFEKEDYIKETLVEYSRQIRKNLISIGNLSQDEIKLIGTSQLRTLVKFIQEMEEDFE